MLINDCLYLDVNKDICNTQKTQLSHIIWNRSQRHTTEAENYGNSPYARIFQREAATELWRHCLQTNNFKLN